MLDRLGLYNDYLGAVGNKKAMLDYMSKITDAQYEEQLISVVKEIRGWKVVRSEYHKEMEMYLGLLERYSRF